MSENYTYHPPDITIDLSFILSSLRILIVKIYYIYIHTMSVLMLLSRLAGAGNFYFNSFLPFLSVVSVLSCQAMSFQILFCELFPGFPWSTFFFSQLFQFFKLHNLTCLGINVSTHNMTIHRRQLWIISSVFTTTPILSKEYQSTPYQPVLPHTSA